MSTASQLNVYDVCDKKTGEKLVRLVSNCVKTAQWKFYSTKGFSHYTGQIVVKMVGRTEPVSTMHEQTKFRLRLAQEQRDSLLAALQMLIAYKGLPCGPDNRDLWAEARKTAAEVTKNL